MFLFTDITTVFPYLAIYSVEVGITPDQAVESDISHQTALELSLYDSVSPFLSSPSCWVILFNGQAVQFTLTPPKGYTCLQRR